MANRFVTFLVFCTVFLATAANAQSDSQSGDWAYTLEPYLQFTSIEGDTSLGRVTGVDLDIDFSDILENLELAGMVHFEAIKGDQWGFILDYGFMKLGADGTNDRGGVASANVRQGVFEALLMRRLDKGNDALDLFAGIRWWDTEVSALVDPALTPGSRSADTKQDWIDLVIGARWQHPINDKWAMTFRGDVGGFGLESDFTSGVSLSAFYSFKPSLSLELAYRAVWVDFEDGTPQMPGYFAYDTVTHGPLIGLAFKF
jgi:hypothetical protein